MQIVIVVIVLILSLFCGAGCASSTVKRAGIVTAATAAGGLAGYHLGDEKPAAVAMGAAGGALLTSLVMGEDDETLQKGFDGGYVQGQSDAIKRHYWMRQDLERRKKPANKSQEEGTPVVYVMPGPEITVDGKKIAPHKVAVRDVE